MRKGEDLSLRMKRYGAPGNVRSIRTLAKTSRRNTAPRGYLGGV